MKQSDNILVDEIVGKYGESMFNEKLGKRPHKTYKGFKATNEKMLKGDKRNIYVNHNKNISQY